VDARVAGKLRLNVGRPKRRGGVKQTRKADKREGAAPAQSAPSG
jgi:hypothetical protein